MPPRASLITRVSTGDKLRGPPVLSKHSGAGLEKHRGLLRGLPDSGWQALSPRLVAMTQQQYPGQFSQSTGSEGEGAASGRSGEFSRFRASLPRRSREHRILSGVCGGLAEAWNMPVTAVRVGGAPGLPPGRSHVPGLRRGLVPHARRARPRPVLTDRVCAHRVTPGSTGDAVAQCTAPCCTVLLDGCTPMRRDPWP